MIEHTTIASRLSAALLGITLTLGAVSMTACKKEEAVKEKPQNVYRTEVLFESSFSYNDDAAGRTEFQSLDGIGNRLILRGAVYDEYWNMQDLLYDVNPETGDMTEIHIPPINNENGEYRSHIAFSDDGSVWYTVNAGYYEEDTGIYRDTCDLYRVDTDGNILASADLYDLFGVNREGTYLYINSMQFSGGTAIIAVDTGIYSVDAEMTRAAEIKIDDLAYVNTMIPCDGGVYVSYTTSAEYKQKLVKIDTAANTVGAPLDFPSAVSNYLYDAMESETYDIVYKSTIGMYGYDIASNTTTELVNWINSDINASSISDAYITPDGIVYALVYSYTNNGQSTQVLKMTRIPDDQVVEKYMLTYGCLYVDHDVLNAIIDFNRASEEYRISVIDYSSYNSESNDYNGGVTQFNNDIISGKIPDIIQVSAELSMSNYAAKGLFADLRPLMENDPVFAKEDLYENILNAFSVGGKLYQITPYFSVQTLAAKSSLVGDYDGWTMEEMNAAIAKLEPGTDPFGGEVTREAFLRAICSYVRDQFIDPDTGKCSFSSPEFIKILEFAKTLPEKTYWETTNWEEIDDTFYIELETRFRDDRSLLYQLYLSNYTYFWETQEGIFGERISLVGYPNENRLGATIYPATAFSVSEQSLCKEGAWAFISDYFAKQKQTDVDDLYQFSIFRSVNAKLAERALAYHDNYWYESGKEDNIIEEVLPASVDEEMLVNPYNPYAGLEDGKKTWTYWIGNQQLDIGMMTEEAVARVDAYLESLTQCYQYDEAMMNIIFEDASAFFAGQKSAEEVANLIQSRVSIYVAESR